ncbi:MAG: peroxiredoxin family protein [Deltaproteobacteria bacterium]|nr:peroxiredoxin family protein [Deltaproteobacteria bacterium]
MVELSKGKGKFAELGATVVAVSIDEPEQSQKLRQRLSIELVLYSDTQGKAASAWKVWDAETELALAASFVVAPGGQVIYRYVGTNKADRPPVTAFLDAIRSHKSK